VDEIQRPIEGLDSIAAAIGIGRRSVKRLIREGWLPVQSGSRLRVASTDDVAVLRHQRSALPSWENEGGAVARRSTSQ